MYFGGAEQPNENETHQSERRRKNVERTTPNRNMSWSCMYVCLSFCHEATHTVFWQRVRRQNHAINFIAWLFAPSNCIAYINVLITIKRWYIVRKSIVNVGSFSHMFKYHVQLIEKSYLICPLCRLDDIFAVRSFNKFETSQLLNTKQLQPINCLIDCVKINRTLQTIKWFLKLLFHTRNVWSIGIVFILPTIRLAYKF